MTVASSNWVEFDPDTLVRQLFTLRDWVRWGASTCERAGVYFGHGTDNAWDEAAFIVLCALRLPWERLPDAWEARVTEAEARHIVNLFERRVRERIPAPYVTGEAWFSGLRLAVNEHVLVPRSPIAELIHTELTPWLQREPRRILDLCTGSGCLAILAALTFPEAQVVGSDISPEACKIARANVSSHDLAQQVDIVESDLFDTLGNEAFDVIISNPPYVDAEDFAGMPDEYRAEPASALASGNDGLDLTRNILQQASRHLASDGLLVVEVGNSQPALEDAFPHLPFVWPEFEHGGHGVFVLTAEQLNNRDNPF